MLRGIYRLAILCLLFVSCEDRKIISDLRKVDDLVMQRHEIYDDYERSLQPLKTRLHLADTDFQKWELADSLHSAYEHFSLDSTLEYIRLQQASSADGITIYLHNILNKETGRTDALIRKAQHSCTEKARIHRNHKKRR